MPKSTEIFGNFYLLNLFQIPTFITATTEWSFFDQGLTCPIPSLLIPLTSGEITPGINQL